MSPALLCVDHVSVCVCTYRRNELLERLLRTLARQRTAGSFKFSIVVVDNDTSGQASAVVAAVRSELGLDITYAIEPEHTIPAARNHALKLARGNYIGIIDDDEFAPADWLLQMYDAIQTFGVDGVLGAVHPYFEGSPPSWLPRSGICDLPVYRTGTILHWSQTRTGNVLLKRSVFDDHGLAFDPRFRTGGSDQDFFRRAMERGYRFTAVAEAAVYEVVPPVRWTRGYWVKRALVNGFNAEKYASTAMSRGRRGLLTAKSVVGAVACSAAMPVATLMGPHRAILCLEKGSYHLSRACASFGIELWRRRDF